MGKGYECRLRCFAYTHKKLNKHLCQFKKSLDELADALGCGKKKKCGRDKYTKTLKGCRPLRVFYSVYLRNILIILSMNPL